MNDKVRKPWRADERPNDERLTDFYSRDEGTAEWLLMSAWDDVPYSLSWHQGILKTKFDADKRLEHDPLVVGWISSIAKRIGELDQIAPVGEPSREELLERANEGLGSSGRDDKQVTEIYAALRRESQRRIAMPIVKLTEYFTKEADVLGLSDQVKAGYLRDVIARFETLVDVSVLKGMATTIDNATQATHSRASVRVVAVQWVAESDKIANDIVRANSRFGQNKKLLANKVHKEMAARLANGDERVTKRGGRSLPDVGTVERDGLPNYGRYGAV